MLDQVAVILSRPKFPENVGAVARACANMGCPTLTLVEPRQWDPERAAPMATPQAGDILRRITVHDSLAEALAPYTAVYATTARTGGWRKGVLTPARAAERIRDQLAEGHTIAIVFGSEDRGLTNEEIEISGQLVTIPTASAATSLNLAQAALILLYECLKACQERPFAPAGPSEARLTSHAEQQTLFNTIQETLLAIDFLKDDNPEYWMLPVRRFVHRVGLKRNEFNLLMGICRQALWAAKAKPVKESTE